MLSKYVLSSTSVTKVCLTKGTFFLQSRNRAAAHLVPSLVHAVVCKSDCPNIDKNRNCSSGLWRTDFSRYLWEKIPFLFKICGTTKHLVQRQGFCDETTKSSLRHEWSSFLFSGGEIFLKNPILSENRWGDTETYISALRNLVFK